ncbi:hypothetical protein BH10PAT1_BH10PAT1_3300 [soil metagenome]
MTGKKRILTLLILSLFVYAWYLFFYTRENPVVVQVTPVTNNLTLFVQPESGSQFVLDEINNAKKEVLVEVYLLSDKDVISSLENAEIRGINVEVMMEQHPFGGGGLNPKTKSELESHHVKVQWSNPAFALTHEKSILIDDSVALILTQNLTLSSFTKNREYDIVDKNQKDVDEIRNIFINDWNRTNFIPSINNIIESPNTSRPALTSLINSAQKEIDIEVEDINDKAITSLLISESKIAKVKLIVPPIKTISSNAKSVNLLVDSGIQVKTISTPYIHAKLILIDNKNAYLGSINFSSQSLDENRELGIIISQSNIIQNLVSVFNADWEKGILLTSQSAN